MKTIFAFLVVLLLGAVLVIFGAHDLAARVQLAVVPVLLLLASFFIYPKLKKATERELTTPAHLRHTFEQLYANELLSDETERFERTYALTIPGIEHVVQRFPLSSFPSVTAGQITALTQAKEAVQELLEKVSKSLNKIE